MILTSKHEIPRTGEEPQTNPSADGHVGATSWASEDRGFGGACPERSRRNACGTRGNSNIQSSPEEKAMMDTYNLSEFGSFTRARQIAGAVILLLVLTLAGSPRLWGSQCDQNPSYIGAGLALSPGSVVGGSGTVFTATITLNGVAGPYPFYAAGFFWITGDFIPSRSSHDVYIWTCMNSATVEFTAGRRHMIL